MVNDMIWPYLLLVLLILISAFFSGAETAVTAVSNLRIRFLVRKKVEGAKTLEEIKKNPRKLINTVLIGSNLVNTAAAAIATYLATASYGSRGVGIATGIMTFLLLFFGDIMPKNFAIHHAERVALFVARPLQILTVVFRPFVLFFEFTSNFFFGKDERSKEKLISEELLRSLVGVGVEEKAIEPREQVLIERVLRFNDTHVEDVMTHRTKVFCLNEKMTIRQALAPLAEYKYSRVPIYNRTRDNITGVILMKDVLVKMKENDTEKSLRDIAVEPFFVPEKTVINEVFRELKQKRVHMAIVVDSHSGTAGIVTMEDLIEEILGDIKDETDVKMEFIKKIGKKSIEVDGNTTLREINHFFGVDLPEKKAATVNGYLLNRLKKIPQNGDVLTVKNLTFEVLEVGEKSILKVKIKKR